MRVFGIDAGLSGALVLMNDGVVTDYQSMPTRVNPRGKKEICALTLWEILHYWQNKHDCQWVDLAVVEQLHALPGDGKVSLATFMKGVGKILAVLEILGIPREEPTPQQWKKVVLAGTDKSKDAAVGYVQSRYPTVNLVLPGSKKPSHDVADAVCLAEYGRRLLLGDKYEQ